MTGHGRTKDRSQEDIHRESLALSRQFKKGIVPYMEEEVQRFEEEVAAFRAGQVDEKHFMPFRLRQGVYGQRQPNAQMFRVKIPGGILTPEALEALGSVVERFAPLSKGHITTRENIQIHHLRLEDCAEAMRLLASANISGAEPDPAAAPEWSRIVAGPWLAKTLERLCHPEALARVDPGDPLKTTLRPYQQAGVQWLHLLSTLGLGACLAEDIGLGKTMQVLELLLILRETHEARGPGRRRLRARLRRPDEARRAKLCHRSRSSA
jgi:SNF2 family DNA or RNA helicase